MQRQLKKEVKIGSIKIGGTNPIAVQTMLNVPVKDIAGNVAQAQRVAAAGCQIVRVTVPTPADAAVVAAIKEKVDIPVVADIHFDYRAALAALDAGADKIRINSAAVFNPEFVQEASQRFGAQCIVVAIDAKKTGANTWEIFTHGGRKPTGIDAIEWAVKMAEFGAGELLITSMDADGTKAGYDLALMRQINDRVTIPTIASGGVGNLQHLADGILKGGADAVLAASIFHFGQHTIPEAKQYLAAQGIEIRL